MGGVGKFTVDFFDEGKFLLIGLIFVQFRQVVEVLEHFTSGSLDFIGKIEFVEHGIDI